MLSNIIYISLTELEDTLSFALNFVRVVGMVLISVYLAVGLADGPINHIRGYRDPKEELQEVVEARTEITNEIAAVQENGQVINILKCLYIYLFD